MNLKKFSINSFFGKLLLSHLIIIFISLTVIGIMFGYLVQNYYFGLKEWEATNNSRRIAELVSENITGGNIFNSNDLSQTKAKITTIARSTNMDIGLMDTEGDMIFNAPTIENNITLEKKEIEHVLSGNAITKKIMGPEFKNLLMVFPLMENKNNGNLYIKGPQPVGSQDKLAGAITIQTSLGSVTSTVNNIIKLVLYSFLVAITVAVILSISFTKKVTSPLNAIQKSALKSTKGNFQEVEIPENSSKEIKHLVDTFNYSVTQINETLEKRRRLEKMQKKFVANVSHEFRAPLTSIKGFIELIQEQDLTPEEIQEYIDIMEKDTNHLEELLSNLLVLNKLEAGKNSLQKEYVSPKNLIHRALKTNKNQANKKKITFDVNMEDDFHDIYVDATKIYQVLNNLLENAINYSPEGGLITVTVSTSTSEKGSVNFSISDQGPGIPEKERENIWQRFYKLDSARTREQKAGSGLGLSIVKDIVEKHGGEVKVESIPGEGSTFSFIV